MDADKLPAEHDVIVLGTGMTESIIAAALSRIGLRVLHLDRNDNYGGDWGSFNFSSLQNWISAFKGETELMKESMDQVEMSLLVAPNEKLILLPTSSSTISKVQENICIPGLPEGSKNFEGDANDAQSTIIQSAEGKSKLTEEPSQLKENVPPAATAAAAETVLSEDGNNLTATSGETDERNSAKAEQEQPESHRNLDFSNIKRLWRKFSIDLMPKILYSRGPLVELLISSDVAKYCEFRSITRILTLLKGKLELVPCSRADVFASHDVSVIEKRMLMKLLTFAIEFHKHPDQYAGFEERPFVEFLKSKNLTETIRHYVQHAIAMVTDSATTLEGLTATQKFLLSLGRYGNTAYLWPLYGSGELLQCFCRMCAVFGGIYCLRRSARAIILDGNEKVLAIVDTQGQRLETKWLIMDSSYASPQLLPQNPTVKCLSRAVLITDRSLKPDNEQHLTVLSLPLPGRNDSRVILYELSSLSLSCPEGFYVIHMTCDSLTDEAKTDLEPVLSVLFQSTDQDNVDDTRPCIIWSLFFNINDTSKIDVNCSVENMFIVGGPDSTLDCDHSISVAKNIFGKICPGEEFLPKAPNPEDIILDDGETIPPARESGFEPIPEASMEVESADAGVTSNKINDDANASSDLDSTDATSR